MDQNNSSASPSLKSLEGFVQSMVEKNDVGDSISSSPDNCGICSTLSPATPESSPIISPFNDSNDFPLSSNNCTFIPLSGTDVSEIGDISDSNVDVTFASIPSPTANPSSDASNSVHQCFGKRFLIPLDFSKSCDIHYVNRRTGAFASTWKIWCLECTEKEIIVDLLVEIVYSFLTTADGEHCFLVAFFSHPFELFLIRAIDFSKLCPASYSNFYNTIESYNSLLSDLLEKIEEHKKIVEKCFEAEILRPYKNDPSLVDISKVPDSIDAKNAVLQIKQLFCLEFKYEMAEYMRKHIDLGIMDFIWNFYDNRDSTYAIISKEDVEKVYIKFYDDLAKQS